MVPIRSDLAKPSPRGRIAGLWRTLPALRRCFWIPLCAVASVSHAGDPGGRFDQWLAVQTNLQSWSADFIQTRSLKVLAQPLVATGKVWVTTPGLFRWELGQPAQTIALRQPTNCSSSTRGSSGRRNTL